MGGIGSREEVREEAGREDCQRAAAGGGGRRIAAAPSPAYCTRLHCHGGDAGARQAPGSNSRCMGIMHVSSSAPGMSLDAVGGWVQRAEVVKHCCALQRACTSASTWPPACPVFYAIPSTLRLPSPAHNIYTRLCTLVRHYLDHQAAERHQQAAGSSHVYFSATAADERPQSHQGKHLGCACRASTSSGSEGLIGAL